MSKKLRWKDVWNFIWHDDSVWSWLVNFVIAFVLVKFIIYPGFGFLLGTSYPMVAVVSSSMEHDGSFDNWWASQSEWYEANDINKIDFLDFSFKNGFNKGDIMVLKGVKTKDIKVGDVIVFRGNTRDPIIHRVVKSINENGGLYFQTKGDHNSDSYPLLGELKIGNDRIIGKAIFRIPLLGWVKVGFVEVLNLVR